jgi:hypothetical protein
LSKPDFPTTAWTPIEEITMMFEPSPRTGRSCCTRKNRLRTFFATRLSKSSTLADAAMGTAFASTLAPDESFTTVELKINFFRLVSQAQLTAEGTACGGATRSATSSAPLTDEQNRLVGKAASVWHFPARRPKGGNPLSASLTSAHRKAPSG